VPPAVDRRLDQGHAGVGQLTDHDIVNALAALEVRRRELSCLRSGYDGRGGGGRGGSSPFRHCRPSYTQPQTQRTRARTSYTEFSTADLDPNEFRSPRGFGILAFGVNDSEPSAQSRARAV
jgi:hypothetical protein